jgi:hypothetical protein
VRSVIEDSRVSRVIDDAKLKWQRADDAWDAISWIIAREPEIGRPITESGYTRSFTLDGAKSIELPTVTVLYEVTAMAVIVHDARFEDAKFTQAGRA